MRRQDENPNLPIRRGEDNEHEMLDSLDKEQGK